MLINAFPHGMQQYLVGGLFIGLGIATLFVSTGRMGGVSTFFSAIWSYVSSAPYFQSAPIVSGRRWRLVYSTGLVLGGALYVALGLPVEATHVPAWKLAVGGAISGFGARLGGGCTSGHGICGMASLSVGSMLIVLTFLSTAIVVAHVVRALGI